MSPAHDPLIDAAALEQHLGAPGWIVIDVRFRLTEPDFGRTQWTTSTIPGARLAELDHDLSAPVRPGVTGRHPLPAPEAFAETLGRWGVTPTSRVIVFDQMGGAFAARLWWMLRWIGHASVAVLDGGWSAWSDLGHPTAPGVTDWAPAAAYPVAPNPSMTVDAAAVSAARADPAVALLDARAAERYRGENETTDPVAGHIPGAVSLPFSDNLDDIKRLRPTAALRERFNAALSDRDPAKAIAYCGSGVTACHNIWAMTCAGLAAPRLYPGSWSEWITDPRRPRTS